MLVAAINIGRGSSPIDLLDVLNALFGGGTRRERVPVAGLIGGLVAGMLLADGGWPVDELGEVERLAELVDQFELGFQVVDVVFFIFEDLFEQVG